MHRFVPPWLLSAILVCLVGLGGRAEAPSDEPNLATVRTIAQRLYSNLDARTQKTVAEDTIALDSDPSPRVHAVHEGGVLRVRVSTNAVELMNRLALALAINRIDHNYLPTYLAALAQCKPGDPIPALPDSGNPRFTKLEVVNDHLSNFNQIVGGLVSIALSQQQLGIPETPSATPDQWMKAVRKGAENSLACAFGIEGLADFYEAIEKIPTRPKWANEFIPSGIKARKVRKDLEKVARNLLER